MNDIILIIVVAHVIFHVLTILKPVHSLKTQQVLIKIADLEIDIDVLKFKINTRKRDKNKKEYIIDKELDLLQDQLEEKELEYAILSNFTRKI